MLSRISPTVFPRLAVILALPLLSAAYGARRSAASPDPCELVMGSEVTTALGWPGTGLASDWPEAAALGWPGPAHPQRPGPNTCLYGFADLSEGGAYGRKYQQPSQVIVEVLDSGAVTAILHNKHLATGKADVGDRAYFFWEWEKRNTPAPNGIPGTVIYPVRLVFEKNGTVVAITVGGWPPATADYQESSMEQFHKSMELHLAKLAVARLP